jgi:hypothetical protein
MCSSQRQNYAQWLSAGIPDQSSKGRFYPDPEQERLSQEFVSSVEVVPEPSRLTFRLAMMRLYMVRLCDYYEVEWKAGMFRVER